MTDAQWRPDDETIAGIATTVGSDPQTWSWVGAGGTAHVCRVPGLGIARISGSDSAATAAAQLRWGALLASAGVPVAAPHPDFPCVISHGDIVATLWCDLGPPGPTDYRALGAALSALHTTGSTALAGDPDVPRAWDRDDAESALVELVRHRLVTGDELALLRDWTDRIDSQLAGPTGSLPVLVHDDVWAKNVITTDGDTWIVDLDNLAWAPREHDLSFLSRQVAYGLIADHDGHEFVAGYGADLPDLDTAWDHTLVHQFRWTLSLLRRRRLHPSLDARVRERIAAWSHPGGPRAVYELNRKRSA